MAEPIEKREAPPGGRRLKIITRRGALRLGIFFAVAFILCVGAWSCMIRMPGTSYSGGLPPLTPKETELASALRQDVEELAVRIGIRNTLAHDALSRSADWVEGRLKAVGYSVSRQTFEVSGKAHHNVEAEIAGGPEIVVVGAHYDSVIGCPGANDNGSGTAALLALAKALSGSKPERTLRFVAFCNEEPPHFMTDTMGSMVYAKRCRERGERIVAMLSIETIGYYSDEKGSQEYPFPLSSFYPSEGNFIAFVGNISSRALAREAIASFRKRVKFPSEGAALPGWMPGVGWSDHWSFWKQGYPAIMITDTAPFRYPHYHTTEDTPDKIDYDRFARVTAGVELVVRDIARIAP